MIDSKQFWQIETPRELSSTVVDSGIRMGKNIQYLLFNTELVSGDTISFTLNGVSISQAYNTSFSNTITLLLAQINAVVAVSGSVGEVVVKKIDNVEYVYQVTMVSKEGTQLVIGALRVVNTGVDKFPVYLYEYQSLQMIPAIVTVDVNNVEALRIDSSGGTTYTGYALPGSSSANPVWRIKRTVVAGAITTVTYPNGSSNFDKVWNDRATYTYS